MNSLSQFIHFCSRKCIWKCHLENGDHFFLGLNKLTLVQIFNAMTPIYWLYIHWTLRNQFQWNSNQSTIIFVQENAFEFQTVVCKMVLFCTSLNLFHKMSFSTPNLINSLWPSDTLWQPKSGTTLAKVMVWCLKAPSHYLNQGCLIIRKVQRNSSEGNFTRNASAIDLQS